MNVVQKIITNIGSCFLEMKTLNLTGARNENCRKIVMKVKANKCSECLKIVMKNTVSETMLIFAFLWEILSGSEVFHFKMVYKERPDEQNTFFSIQKKDLHR
jgi:hypothetical protein